MITTLEEVRSCIQQMVVLTKEPHILALHLEGTGEDSFTGYIHKNDQSKALFVFSSFQELSDLTSKYLFYLEELQRLATLQAQIEKEIKETLANIDNL